jgi:hypothetical protein
MLSAHVGEVSNKGYEVSLRWDDKITDNLSYWVGSNNKTKKSLKKMLPAPINGGDLANGQFTKLLDNSSIGKPLGSFYHMITLVLTQKMVKCYIILQVLQ